MEKTEVRYWEVIADNLSASGWSWGCVSAVNSHGRTIWIVDAHRDGKRFIVRADEKLTAVQELEPAIWFVAYYRCYQFAAGCGDEIRAAAARSDAASVQE
jgi:hypothetical protein